MSVEVAVALIAAAAALASPIVAWALNRQANRDLRSNVERDLDMLRTLVPDSSSAQLLEWNIQQNLQEIAMRDQRRAHLIYALVGPGRDFVLAIAMVVILELAQSSDDPPSSFIHGAWRTATWLLFAWCGFRTAGVVIAWRKRRTELKQLDFWSGT